MDTEVLFRINEDVLAAAVLLADRNGYSFPELIDYLLRKAVGDEYKQFEDFPIADWVRELGEGPVTFEDAKLTWKERKAEWYESKMKKT